MIMIVQKPTATSRKMESARPLRRKKPILPALGFRRRSRAAIKTKTATTTKGSRKRMYLLTGELALRQLQGRLGGEADLGLLALLRQRSGPAPGRQHDLLLRRSLQEDVAEIALEGDVQDRALDRALDCTGAEAQGFRPDEKDGAVARLQPLPVAGAQASHGPFHDGIRAVGGGDASLEGIVLADEGGDEGGGRIVIDRFAVADLLDHPLVHDRDAVRHGQR